jgi:hypothetical protein
MLCGPSSRRRWFSSAPARSQGGASCCCALADRRHASSAAALTPMLFAHVSRVPSSPWRRNPVAPRLLVAAMQERAHRQCAGTPCRGIVSSSICNPSLHAVPFASEKLSSSTRKTPPRSLNMIMATDDCDANILFAGRDKRRGDGGDIELRRDDLEFRWCADCTDSTALRLMKWV